MGDLGQNTAIDPVSADGFTITEGGSERGEGPRGVVVVVGGGINLVLRLP